MRSPDLPHAANELQRPPHRLVPRLPKRAKTGWRATAPAHQGGGFPQGRKNLTVHCVLEWNLRLFGEET
jgi:hypothetical protein